MIIPDGVKTVLDRLSESNIEGYLVGGCVRDMLMGQAPKDYDICAAAPPEKLCSAFSDFRVIETGLKHGTITVLSDGEAVEVTSYRSDGGYSDGRHPDTVSFSATIEDDLARRDFTVNAMAMGADGRIVDLFGGREDLQSGIIRTVGDPRQRFSEDALRIMRGIRFASVKGFTIENKTAAAMLSMKSRLNLVSQERIFTELKLLLTGENAGKILVDYAPIIYEIIPEAADCYNFPQRTKYHKYDVWRHIAATVDAVRADETLRLTMLLHDIAKPACHRAYGGSDHFKGHPMRSAEMARGILERLKCDKKTEETVLTLIKWHDIRPELNEKNVLRLMNRLGCDILPLLFECQAADTMGKADEYLEYGLERVAQLREIYRNIIEKEKCYSLKMLAVGGEDLIGLGVPKGKAVGIMLNKLLDEVISGKIENERETLLGHARKLLCDGNATDGCENENPNV